MPEITFTASDDTYTVRGGDTFDLRFLSGSDLVDLRGTGFTRAYMGDGADRAIFRSGSAVVYGEAGSDRFDVFASDFEGRGGSGNDLFMAYSADDAAFYGEEGEDRINFAGDAADVLVRAGVDDDGIYGYFHEVTGSFYGDAGNDNFAMFGVGASLYGGTGNDTYRVEVRSTAAVVELASEGTDLVNVARGYSYVLPANVENLSARGFSGSTAASATLTGNAMNNVIRGHSNVETILGLGGDDLIIGYGGDDWLEGGDGSDRLLGGTGNDSLLGGAGNDRLDGQDGGDTMTGGAGADTYFVDNISDVLIEVGSDRDIARVSVSEYVLPLGVEDAIIATNVGLKITGNNAGNNLTGRGGADWLYGGDGDDVLRGKDGYDRIFGDAGNDVLIGGGGGDDIRGGTGTDIFVYTHYTDSYRNRDEPLTGGVDYLFSADLIDLSALDADPYLEGDQAIDFESAIRFSHSPDEIGGRGDHDNAVYTTLTIDIDSNGTVDMTIMLDGHVAVTESLFIL